MKVKTKEHQRALAHEFKDVSQEAIDELHAKHLPKTARAMMSLGTLVPSLVDRVPSLTSPLYKHKGRAH